MNANHPDYVPSVFPGVYGTSAGNSKVRRADRLDRARKRAEDKEATMKRAEEKRREEEARIHSEEREMKQHWSALKQ